MNIEALLLGKRERGVFDRNPLVGLMEFLAIEEKNNSVAKIASKLNKSERGLERLFRKYVGLSPREFLSLRRLRKALAMLQQLQNSKLSDVAFQCGYFDQPHFNRSFKKWMGVSPTAFLTQMETPTSVILRDRIGDLTWKKVG